MPSKSKKQSKTASRLSNSDQSVSPCTPSSVPPQYKEVSELDILDAASTKYPKMIGKSAFIGRIADIDPDYKGCRVWLAESSMVSSSISPGSLVSVSLPALERGFSSTSPISSMGFECSRKFEIEPVCEAVNEVGNYFALATVFPSSKVPKDGVRLSSNLSYTMGSPAIGWVVFVYPLWNQHVTGLENGNDRPQNIKYDPLLHDCNDLHLELVSFKDVTKPNGCVETTSSFSAEKDVDRSENGMISSPKTPLLCLSKCVSSTPVQVSSPRSIGTASDLSTRNTQCLELFNTAEVLKDESAKKLLQACAASWLYSRFILVGNIVAIPILSKLCIFQVRSANMSTADGTKNDLEEEKTHSLHTQFSESIGHFHDAFSVNFKTKVYLSLPSNSATETPQTKGLASKKLEQGRTNGGVVSGVPKLGGLHKEYAILKDIIVSSLKNTLSSLGLRTTKGVLLHGPPGTGKTSLARLCVADAGVNLFCINGPEIISQYHGESEQAMHEVFDSACRASPAVVFIDELDAIAPARKDGGEELSQRMVASLLNLMDGISRTEGLLIIAATNRPDSIEPALRRPGRLDREIEIGVPSPKQRSDILHTLLSKMDHSISDEQVQHLAMATHGFVGADLASLCNEAALVCLRRFVRSKKSLDDVYSRGSPVMFKGCSSMVAEIPDRSLDRRDILMDSASSNISEIADDLQNSISEEILVEEESMLKVVAQDFEKARVKVRPSAMREVILEIPKVSWEDVGGQDEVKTQLIEAVEWPQKHHDAFKRIGTRPPTGILMFGPPGCSKTLVARAVASEAGLNFLAVKGPELFSKWVGESEKAVRSLFAKARANAPSIIFFDEIDGLAVIRGNESDGVSVSDRVMSQLLIELDGLHQRVNVTVIAATNRPDKIDPALLRPGRFDRLLYVGPPNENDREAIFRIHLRKIPCSSDVNIKELASLTDGYTGADISLICREAAVAAIEESIGASEVTMHHFETAIQQVQPSDVHSYEELSSKFQRVVHCSHSEGLEYQKQPSASSWFGIRALIKLTAQFFDFSASSSKSVSSG